MQRVSIPVKGWSAGRINKNLPGYNPMKQNWLKLHQNWCSLAEMHHDLHPFWCDLGQSSFIGLAPAGVKKNYPFLKKLPVLRKSYQFLDKVTSS